MTMNDDEISVEESRPREGYEIQHGTQIYYLTSGTRSRLIAGNLYIAFPIGRHDFGIAFVGNDAELEIKLPTTHPFTRRYFQGGIPPKTCTVRARRLQLRSGEQEQFWYGNITSCTVSGEVASFRAPAASADALSRMIPNITVGRACPYVLYEAGCRIPRAAFRVSTTATLVDGASVTVASDGGNPDLWFQFGEIVHVASGERMTIYDHVGNVLTMQLPMAEMHAGDAVQIFAGCDHTVPTCRDKFNNLVNYGGTPALPRGNIFLPNGYGIYQSSSS